MFTLLPNWLMWIPGLVFTIAGAIGLCQRFTGSRLGFLGFGVMLTIVGVRAFRKKFGARDADVALPDRPGPPQRDRSGP